MILNSSVSRLFISIDAATEETYNKIRIPTSKRLLESNRLEKLEKNIKRFIEMKNSRKQALPLTRVSFVALEENKHEVEMHFANEMLQLKNDKDFSIIEDYYTFGHKKKGKFYHE